MQKQLGVTTRQHRVPKSNVLFELAASRQRHVEIVQNLSEGRVGPAVDPNQIDIHPPEYDASQCIAKECIGTAIGVFNFLVEESPYLGKLADVVSNEQICYAVIDDVDLLQTQRIKVDLALNDPLANQRKSQRVAKTHKFPYVIGRIHP
jgi:hypothetical protein